MIDVNRRPFGKNPTPLLSDDGCRRVREHLKSAGIDFDSIPKLVWPEGAVSASQKHMYAPWEFIYKSDILKAKKEGMEQNLWWKRQYHTTEIRALYVWVFWCPGISGFFKGLWTYFVGIGGDYRGGGYKGEVSGSLLDDVMDLFPLVDKPLFTKNNNVWEYHNEWQQRFVRKYQRGKWCGKPQGKAPVWAEVEEGSVKKIIGRIQWPQ